MKKVLITFVCGFMLAIAPSNAQQPCNTFECAYQKAERILRTSTAKDKYQQVLANLDDADNYAGNDPERKEKVRALRREAFLAIQGEKERADVKTREARANLDRAERLITHFNFGNEKVAWAYRDGLFAIIDLEGKLLTDFIFEAPASFSNSIALAMIGGQWVFINSNGEVLSRPYDFVIFQSNGYYFCGTVARGTTFDYEIELVNIWNVPSDLNPVEKIPIINFYTSVLKLNSHLFFAQKENGEWVKLDEFGRFLGKAPFLDVFTDWRMPIIDPMWGEMKFLPIIAKLDSSLCGAIDSTGNWIIYPSLVNIFPFFDEVAGAQQIDLMWGFVNLSGNWIVDPRFIQVMPFWDGLAAVQDIDFNWGFIDTLGEWIIPPSFSDAYYFSEGYAPAKKDSLWGFIDKTGEWKILPRFHEAKAFFNGVAEVRYDFSSGLIDTSGRLIIPIEYSDVYRLKSNELFVAQDTNNIYFLIGGDGRKLDSIMLFYNKYVGQWTFYFNHYFAMGNGELGSVFFANRNSFEWSSAEQILSIDSLLIGVRIDGEWDVYSDNGEKSNEVQKWDEIIFEYDGFARVQKDSLWGLVDRNGKIVVEPRYINVIPYSWNNIILVQSEQDSLWGFIDTTGNVLYEPQFEGVHEFLNGCATVTSKDGVWMEIDISPTLPNSHVLDSPVISESFFTYYAMPECALIILNHINKFSFIKQGDLWGVIDSIGQSLVDPQFEEIKMRRDGAAVRKNSLWGIMNFDGRTVVDPQFDEIGEFRHGLARVRKDSLWGYIDKAGEILIEPQFNEIYGFRYGLAPVRAGNYWGFVDTSGNIAIKPQFEYVLSFEYGIAKVEKNSLWGIIDQTGQFVIEPKFDNVDYFQHGVARFRQGDLWGLIDTTGQVVIEPQFEEIDEFQHGLARFQQEDLWGLIDTTGQVVIEPQFEEIDEFQHGLARFRQGDLNLCGYIDFSGQVVIKPQFYCASDFHDGWVYTSELLPDFLYRIPKKLFFTGCIETEHFSNTDFNDFLALVCNPPYYGLIGGNGKIVLPINFDAIGDFKNGYAIVQQSGKLGIIDKDLRLILPCDYSSIDRISLNAFLVEQKGRYGLFDAKEDFLIPPFYEGFGFLGEEFEWIRAKKNNKWGWINKKGEVMIPFRYDVALPFKNGEALVLQEPYLVFFAINKEGEMLSDF